MKIKLNTSHKAEPLKDPVEAFLNWKGTPRKAGMVSD